MGANYDGQLGLADGSRIDLPPPSYASSYCTPTVASSP